MAWLPHAQPAGLRRLQLAAAAQQQLLWVFRPDSAAPQASPALLRLRVQGQAMPGDAAAVPGMRVQILKRRGPPLAQELDLPGAHSRLLQLLAAQAARRHAAQALGCTLVAERASPVAQACTQVLGSGAMHLASPAGPQGRGHALDRAAMALAG